MKNENIKSNDKKNFQSNDSKVKKKKVHKSKTNEQIIKKLQKQLDDQKNSYLSSLANLENDRKRFEKSKNEFIKFSNQMVLEELINILDTFNTALNIPKPTPEVKNFLIGFKMISKQFQTLLTKNGVVEIKTKVGDKFDPKIHSSVEEIKSTKFKSGQIIKIIKKGYKIHNRLLTPTTVKVSK